MILLLGTQVLAVEPMETEDSFITPDAIYPNIETI